MINLLKRNTLPSHTFALLLISFLFLQACAQQPLTNPRSEYHTVFSQALQQDMPYGVYTPLDWSAEERLPLVVLLHGGFDSHETFDRFGVGEYLDQQMAAGRLPRAIVVSPKGDVGFWENWHDGTKDYRDWVVQDVLNDVAKRYPHGACPKDCHLMGISMGGHGVLSLIDAEPDRFGTATVISGRIFNKAVDTPTPLINFLIQSLLPLERIWGPKAEGRAQAVALYERWLNDPVLADKSLLVAWGDEDNADIIAFNEAFRVDLANNNHPHDVIIYDGAHRWVDWKTVIAESLRRQVKP